MGSWVGRRRGAVAWWGAWRSVGAPRRSQTAPRRPQPRRRTPPRPSAPPPASRSPRTRRATANAAGCRPTCPWQRPTATPSRRRSTPPATTGARRGNTRAGLEVVAGAHVVPQRAEHRRLRLEVTAVEALALAERRVGVEGRRRVAHPLVDQEGGVAGVGVEGGVPLGAQRVGGDALEPRHRAEPEVEQRVGRQDRRLLHRFIVEQGARQARLRRRAAQPARRRAWRRPRRRPAAARARAARAPSRRAARGRRGRRLPPRRPAVVVEPAQQVPRVALAAQHLALGGERRRGVAGARVREERVEPRRLLLADRLVRRDELQAQLERDASARAERRPT